MAGNFYSAFEGDLHHFIHLDAKFFQALFRLILKLNVSSQFSDRRSKAVMVNIRTMMINLFILNRKGTGTCRFDIDGFTLCILHDISEKTSNLNT